MDYSYKEAILFNAPYSRNINKIATKRKKNYYYFIIPL